MTPPTLATIQDAVVEILKDVSRRPIEPTLESDLIADLGFDSLQVMEVVTELEDRFDITIPADTLSTGPAAHTVADVIAQVSAIVEGRQRV